MIAPNVTSRKNHYAEVRRQPEQEITDIGISVLASSHDGLWDWYIPEDEFHVSPYWYSLLGYESHEIRPQYETWVRLVHPDDRECIVKQLRDWLRKKDECFEIEFRLRKKSGAWCWILSRGKIIEWNQRNKPVHLIGTYHDITDRKEMTEALQKSEEQLRYLSSRLLSAQEEERRRIALEIHDSIGSSLSAIKYLVEGTLRKLGQTNQEELRDSLKTVVSAACESIAECRRIQTDLRPSLLDDLGIVATLRWLCKRFAAVYSGIRVEHTLEVRESDVPTHLKIVIFRVVQEAMNNISKHSGASAVHLSLQRTSEEIQLTLQDNGRGFDPVKALRVDSTQRGFGLSSMRERVQYSDGRFFVMSRRGQGATIAAIWPLEEQEVSSQE